MDGLRNGWVEGWILIYILPASGSGRYAPEVINAPTAQSWMGRGMGLRVGFININDMYNNDVGKGVVYAYEAYEAK